ncbi:hypothetical protein [Pseudonocardia sp. ICBG601]|uniref:hypothetical protein n=1 Tax=Pseudonocardia sp. ICBG601 TaxID=2846759 RepID=UPI001CF6BD05|nr:hypothetical protein [Pseudonocardia sp. ICBG601]
MTADVLGRTGWATQPPPTPPPPEPAPPETGEASLSDALLGIAANPADTMSTAISGYVKAGVVGVLESVWTAGLAMLPRHPSP